MKSWVSGLLLLAMASFSEATTRLTFEGEVSSAAFGISLNTPFTITITLGNYAVTGAPANTGADNMTSLEWIWAFNMPTAPVYGQIETTGATAPLTNFAGANTSLEIIAAYEDTQLVLLLSDLPANSFQIGNAAVSNINILFSLPFLTGSIYTLGSPDDFFNSHLGTQGILPNPQVSFYGPGPDPLQINVTSVNVESVETIPEPSTFLLMGAAALASVPLLRRMRRWAA